MNIKYKTIFRTTGTPRDYRKGLYLSVGLIQDGKEKHYREEVKLFADWCSKNNLILNVEKTKEVVIDFRRKQRGHCCGDCPTH